MSQSKNEKVARKGSRNKRSNPGLKIGCMNLIYHNPGGKNEIELKLKTHKIAVLGLTEANIGQEVTERTSHAYHVMR